MSPRAQPVPLEVLQLLERHPEHCHGVFEVADRGQLIPDTRTTDARDAFAVALAERRAAAAALERADERLRAAAVAAHAAGAEVTQLAAMAEVARNTAYAWLKRGRA